MRRNRLSILAVITLLCSMGPGASIAAASEPDQWCTTNEWQSSFRCKCTPLLNGEAICEADGEYYACTSYNGVFFDCTLRGPTPPDVVELLQGAVKTVPGRPGSPCPSLVATTHSAPQPPGEPWVPGVLSGMEAAPGLDEDPAEREDPQTEYPQESRGRADGCDGGA